MSEPTPCPCCHQEYGLEARIEELEAVNRDKEMRHLDMQEELRDKDKFDIRTHKTIHAQAKAVACNIVEDGGLGMEAFLRIICETLMSHAGLEGECEG